MRAKVNLTKTSLYELVSECLSGNNFSSSYEIMEKCWDSSPKLRPNFREIESELEAYLEQRAVSNESLKPVFHLKCIVAQRSVT